MLTFEAAGHLRTVTLSSIADEAMAARLSRRYPVSRRSAEVSGTTAHLSVYFLRSIRELLRVCAQKEKVSYTLKV